MTTASKPVFRNIDEILAPIDQFLACVTPTAWLEYAAREENLSALLIDHCNCELKAAQTGVLVMRRYALTAEDAKLVMQWTQSYEQFVYKRVGSGFWPNKKQALSQPLQVRSDLPFAAEIVKKMVALVKEELQHFEQVLAIVQARDIDYQPLSASRYAGQMVKHVSTFEPQALVDKLIIGAVIEARSCERFARLAPLLDSDLGNFYYRLLKSEARHFQDYLTLAEKIASTQPKSKAGFKQRVSDLVQVEAALIQAPDTEFRFHSGIPST